MPFGETLELGITDFPGVCPLPQSSAFARQVLETSGPSSTGWLSSINLRGEHAGIQFLVRSRTELIDFEFQNAVAVVSELHLALLTIEDRRMIIIRNSRHDEGERAIEIWRRAVDATHDFLSQADRQAIDEMVCDFLPQVPLWLAVDANDYPLAFMYIDNEHMEALFVDPACRGTGVGAALVRHGLSLHAKMTTDVNEQNVQAVRFYEKMGFRRTGRSALDGQGRAYPIIHLEYVG